MWFDAQFVMVDGLDFDAPRYVRLQENLEGELTRGFGASPRYQHASGAAWRCIAVPRSMNDDLGMDTARWPDIYVGEIYADTTHEPPELVQVISLRAV